MPTTQTAEDKSVRRLNRAVIAAGAAVVVAVSASAYAVYRVQAVLRGLEKNIETTTALYRDPGDASFDVSQPPAE